MADAPLLEIENLRVEIAGPTGPIPIITGLDMTLAAGESLGVVGESGCGKSMLALAVMGLLPSSARVSGTIRFEGKDLLSLDEAALCRLRGGRLAMIFQEPMTSLNPVKTIGHQVAEGLRLHRRLGRSEGLTQAADMLAQVGLPTARFPLDLYPHQLSGGQRQRVMIAMALACEPALLIADEPTTALDVTIQRQILDLLLELAEARAMALLLITHDLGVVAETTDRSLVMYAGHIVETADTATLFADMAHPYTRGLFAAVPQLPSASGPRLGGETPLPTIPGEVTDPSARPPGCAFAPRCQRVTARCHSQLPSLLDRQAGSAVACFHPFDAVGD